MSALWWTPLAIVYAAAIAYLSFRTRTDGGAWFIAGWAAMAVPLWLFIARTSKNLLYDGMLYDCIMFATYAATFAALGEGSGFGLKQWVGAGVCLIGFILMQ